MSTLFTVSDGAEDDKVLFSETTFQAGDFCGVPAWFEFPMGLSYLKRSFLGVFCIVETSP